MFQRVRFPFLYPIAKWCGDSFPTSPYYYHRPQAQELLRCRRAFRSRDCVVIIYGSITATIMCLRYSPNFLTMPRVGTAGRFCFTSSVSLHRSLGRELSLAVEMLANAQISTCFVRLPLFSQFLYILYKILTAKSRTIFHLLKISLILYFKQGNIIPSAS